jgi:hypothetical protein
VVRSVLAVATALGAMASPAFASIPITDADVTVSDARAGAHPDLTITTQFASGSVFEDDVRDVSVELPPGLLGNPNAAPRCPLAPFQSDSCAASTRVGSVTVNATAFVGLFYYTDDAEGSVYNLDAGPGEAARMGIWVRPEFASFPLQKFSFLTPVQVRPNRGYGLDAAMTGLPRSVSGAPIRTNRVTLELDGSVVNGPFVTNPTSCLPATATVRAVSYDDPGSPTSATSSFTPTQCSTLPFSAGASVVPESLLAESPSGAEIALTVSGSELPRRHAHVRRATVELPEGMGLNPALAVGLESCDHGAFLAGQSCPAASDIGDVTLTTPPLGDVPGDIYFATPTPANPWRTLLALRLPGAVGRLVGDISLDPLDGSITTTFAELPQVPFTTFALHFAGGPRGVFLTPPACGTHTANALLQPWTRTTTATPPDQAPTAAFETILESGCPAEQPFEPGLRAEFDSRTPSLKVRVERPDRHQRIAGMTLTLPGALLDLLGLQKVERCGVVAASQAACPAASRIGSAGAVVGAGPEPVTLEGEVFLTEAAEADVAGISLRLPAKVGPIDLGHAVVPGRVVLRDGGLEVITETLPQIQGGIPLPLRALQIEMDREGTLAKAGACGDATVKAELRGTAGAVARPSVKVDFPACGAEKKGRPTARLSLRFIDGEGLLRGRIRAAKGSPGLEGARIRLPKGLTKKERKVLRFRGKKGPQALLRVRAKGLEASANLAASLRKGAKPHRLPFAVRVRDAADAVHKLRVRVRPKLG